MADLIRVTLPDPITGPDGAPLAVLGLVRPVGKHFRELERRGNMHDAAKAWSLVLDCVVVLSTEPPLSPVLADNLTAADIQAVDDALGPFFAPGGQATGAAA